MHICVADVVQQVTICHANRCSERSEDTLCGAQPYLSEKDMHICVADVVQWYSTVFRTKKAEVLKKAKIYK